MSIADVAHGIALFLYFVHLVLLCVAVTIGTASIGLFTSLLLAAAAALFTWFMENPKDDGEMIWALR